MTGSVDGGMMPGNCAPRSWSLILVGVVTLYVLEDISRLVSLQASTSLVAPAFGLLAIGNYFYLLGGRFRPGDLRQEGETRVRGAWRWFVLPVGLVLVMSALVEPWPMTLRFSISREAFEKKVAEMQATHAEQREQRIGLYWIERADIRPNGYVSFITGTSIIDPVGFAYDPKRPASSWLNRHITGNWYATEW